MSQKLTDGAIKALIPPETGNRIFYDTEVRGLGCRVTAAGDRSFVLNYRTRAGRERRYTIGKFPDWKVGPARDEARELKKAVDRGEDPMGDLEAGRQAPNIGQLCDRFISEHLPKKRPSTALDYKRLIEGDIRPTFGTKTPMRWIPPPCETVVKPLLHAGSSYGSAAGPACWCRLRQSLVCRPRPGRGAAVRLRLLGTR